jgi:hypothetical protein
VALIRYDEARDITLVHWTFRLYATFTEPFELEEFPFE